MPKQCNYNPTIIPFSAVTLLGGWQEERPACRKLCHLCPKVLFQDKYRKKTKGELADPVSCVNQPLKQRCRFTYSDKNDKQHKYLIISYKSSAVAEIGDRGHNRHGSKRGGLLFPFHRGARSPSNTTSTGPRFTSLPSDILIHPAV